MKARVSVAIEFQSSVFSAGVASPEYNAKMLCFYQQMDALKKRGIAEVA
jgi:hypothetical protein